MNEFIEVTKANGGKMITINTNSIIYFRSSKHSKSNRTEILVNGEEKPFVVEECYEDVKSKIYHPSWFKPVAENSASEHDKKETKDKKLNVIKSDYRTTVKEYLEDDNTVCVDYKDLNYDNYATAYKNFLMTHPVFISNDERIIGHIKLAKFKDQLNIVMYMIDINGYIYNMIDYDYYIGRDILSVYLNDLITRRDELDPINGDYKLIVEFPEAIIKNETEDNKELNIIGGCKTTIGEYIDEYYGRYNNSEDYEKETEDNKELNIIIGEYKSTIGEYLKYNNYFIDYRKLYNDRDYRTFYKNFMKTHIFEISDNESSEESIGYLHLKTFRDNSVIVIYMTNAYDEIYYDIYYNESDYMGCDIIAKYLKDCVNRKNIIGNYGYEDYKLDVRLIRFKEDLFIK